MKDPVPKNNVKDPILLIAYLYFNHHNTMIDFIVCDKIHRIIITLLIKGIKLINSWRLEDWTIAILDK